MWGYDFSDTPKKAHIGYFSSGTEQQKLHWDHNHTNILHNYGLGDMGFSLSWGSAMECLRMIHEKNSIYPSQFSPMEHILNNLSQANVASPSL